jgi:hypothetical protein
MRKRMLWVQAFCHIGGFIAPEVLQHGYFVTERFVTTDVLLTGRL